MKSSPPEQLLVREAVAVIALCGLLFGIFAVTAWNNPQITHAPQPEETITVKVRGAVAKPGIYTVPVKASMPALLALADPLPHGALSDDLKITKNLAGERILSIPRQDHLDVYLSGAIAEENWYSLPKNSKICDISNHIPLSSDADSKFLKRRRLLKNGEHLVIPSTAVKSK